MISSNTEYQDWPNGKSIRRVEDAALELSLHTRYLWEIASALSKNELRNELVTIRALAGGLAAAIEGAS